MVSMIESAEKGRGLYSFREVAHYLGVHSNTLRSWFYPGFGRKALLDPNILKTDEDGAWLSFDDFLQAYAVKRLKDLGLKPPMVREAIAEAKQKFGLPYPLSVQGHLVYVDGGKRVIIHPPNEPHPVQLTGPGKRQRVLKPIVERYLDKVEYDDDGLANRFIVFTQTFGSVRHRIVMDPHLNFGEPTVEGTPYRTNTLRRAVDAEGSVEAVARIYEVDESEVMIAMSVNVPHQIAA